MWVQGKLEQLEATKKGMEDVLRTHWDTRAALEENADRLQAEIGRLEADLAAQTGRNGASSARAQGACSCSSVPTAALAQQANICTYDCVCWCALRHVLPAAE